jgi:hypothetical protein
MLWVRQETPPKFQIPSFRVSEAPTWVRSRREPQIPDSEISSFRGPLLWVHPAEPEGPPNVPDSDFSSFRGPLLGPGIEDKVKIRGTMSFAQWWVLDVDLTSDEKQPGSGVFLETRL